VPLEALAPASDPAIQTREFVQAWTVEELSADLAGAAEGRNFQRAQELFTAVSCVQCHRVDGGEGGQVGPDLASVQKKFAEQGWTRLDILKEIITPSERIDEAFQTVIIEDINGRVHTGIVTARNDQTVQLTSNPLEGGASAVAEIPVDDIDQEFPSKISMMPEGLLNTLTKEEILDLVLFIETGGDASHPAFRGGGASGGGGEHEHSHDH
jgi:putative heme-binding domain-containing protein